MDLRALQRITYGMYVIGSRDREKRNAQIANSVVQVCSEPPVIAVCLNKKNLTHDLVRDGKAFSVSILSRDTPLGFIGSLGFKSGREEDKLKGLNYITGRTGAPVVLDNALAYLEASLVSQMDVVTHTIFAGEVVEAQVVREGEPMTYAYYHEVKRGTKPREAPSYVEERKAPAPMKKYRCTVCGYVYEPELGDPEGKVPPGTPFESLPDDWTCPVCGARKSEFEAL